MDHSNHLCDLACDLLIMDAIIFSRYLGIQIYKIYGNLTDYFNMNIIAYHEFSWTKEHFKNKSSN